MRWPRALLSTAVVHAPGGAGFAHNDSAQPRKRGLQAVPNPRRKVLACRVLEALDLIQVVVVQLRVERLEGGLDVTEVHEPTGRRVHVAADVDLDLEAVSVQPSALVPLGHKRQPVSRLEAELLEDRRASSLSGSRKRLGARAAVVDEDLVHTPVASFQAMT